MMIRELCGFTSEIETHVSVGMVKATPKGRAHNP